jgi:peptide-methionine (S)-S-oxide reductase
MRLRGVISATSGYMGGAIEHPDYDAVCTGTTGHAEVVRVVFDNRVLRYADLLEVFFAIHDPTTLNRQGNDVGSQYRSAIFIHSPYQQAIARQIVDALTARRVWPQPIVTEILAAASFWPAEAYHAGYYDAHPYQPYCQFVVAPKVRKLLEKFSDRVVPEARPR